MIELAPAGKRDLSLVSPLMAGSGAVGLADPWPGLVPPTAFGAIISAPVSLRARHGQDPPRALEVAGGFLLNTGDQNPGWVRAREEHAAGWRSLPAPFILALSTHDRAGWAELARRAEEEPGVAGLELHFHEDLEPREVRASLAAVRRVTTLPLLAKLPSGRAGVMAAPAEQGGADALVIGTPPTGSYPSAEGEYVDAPLGGPGALPFTLHALRRAAALDLTTPLVAAGGVSSLEDLLRCLDEGAVAVQVRSLVWLDPAGTVRLAEAAHHLAEAA